MANDLNYCSFIGRVGQPPESKTMPDGTALVNFSIACNESWTGKDGQKQEKTTWIRCTAWRKLAEIISRYIVKGSRVYISGKYTNRSYQKDNETKYISEIIVDKLLMLGGKPQQTQQQPAQQSEKEPEAQKAGGGYAPEVDIPF